VGQNGKKGKIGSKKKKEGEKEQKNEEGETQQITILKEDIKKLLAE